MTDRYSSDWYGEWPDYVEDVVAGKIWLRQPFCPGPDNMWVIGESYTSLISGITWTSYVKRNDYDSTKG